MALKIIAAFFSASALGNSISELVSRIVFSVIVIFFAERKNNHLLLAK